MHFLVSDKRIEQEDFRSLSETVHCLIAGKFHLLISDQEFLQETHSHFVINQGFLNDLDFQKENHEEQLEFAIEQISKTWPAPENITGSFSTALWPKDRRLLTVCNDPLGVYPLYYLIERGSIYVSNSLIWLGAVSNTPLDEVGVFQRCFSPEYATIGSRTILRNSKRLLPGEWIEFDLKNGTVERKYDNSLYQNIDESREDAASQSYWGHFKEEIAYALDSSQEVTIALSGGIDSRMLLGGLPEDKEVICYTYGAQDNYETKIAEKIAKLWGASFKNFHDPWQNFPSSEVLRKYTLRTEGVYLCSWLEILENVEKSNNRIFLLGDLSTALTGRSIQRFSSKSYLQKNFIKHSIWGKGYPLDKNTKEGFSNWKLRIKENFLKSVNQKNRDLLNLQVSTEDIISATTEDLESLFSRIESHYIPYLDLADELFTLYTHTRLSMGKQVLINNSKFQCYCPSLSRGVLKYATSIHPNCRLGQRLVKKMFNEIPDLKKFGKVPTSQIPLIPQDFPDELRFPIWALRSKLDNYLIKRMIKNRDPSKRYRLFKSNDWVAVYQNPFLEERVESYFEKNNLGEGYVNEIKRRSFDRRDLLQWPFANMDIMNAAALNAEINLINENRKNEI